MKIQEQQIVTENILATVAIKCDVCGNIHKDKYLPDDWHQISMHHNHWGNDSSESYEYFDVCSPDCYWKKIKECVSEYEGFTDAKIDDFEIEFIRKLIKQHV